MHVSDRHKGMQCQSSPAYVPSAGVGVAEGSSERSRQERAVNAVACIDAAAPPMAGDPSSPTIMPQLHSERIELHMASVSTPLGGMVAREIQIKLIISLSFGVCIGSAVSQ